MPQNPLRKLNAIDVLGSNGPLTEFRIFCAGVNRSTSGDFVFDASKPGNAYAGYIERGVDVMIDLEHLSLDPSAPHFDPNARGWCQLQLRDGELWAVNVRWTDDGASRLAAKTQRYISPAFANGEEGQIGTICNLALVANPATHHTAALIAASATPKVKTMATDAPPPADDNSGANDGDVLAQIAQFMGLKPPFTAAAFIAAVQGLAAAASGGQPALESADPPPDDSDDVEMAMDPPPPVKPGDKPAKPSPKQLSMARRQLLRVAAKPTAAEAIKEIEIWKAAYADVTAAKKTLADEQAALDFSKRISLAQKLVGLGKETPATSGLNTLRVEGGRTLVELSAHLLSMPLADLEARVTAFGGSSSPAVPAKTPARQVIHEGVLLPELSAIQLRHCQEKKIEPVVYQRFLANQQ